MDSQAIELATSHAQPQDLKIDYRNQTIEDHCAEAPPPYDLVIAMEILEHVNHPDHFITSCSELLKTGGSFVFSTLNRTALSYMLGIVGAEYILRWVPKGTHDWKKFLRPAEIAQWLRQKGFQSTDFTGYRYTPLNNDWDFTSRLHVNYFGAAQRL